MQPTDPMLKSPEFHALQNTLAKARSEQISQVVAAIDGMGTRGIADQIIQRLIELLQSVPTIPIWLALSAALPRDWKIGRAHV